MEPKNLTPNPFPSGKGNKIVGRIPFLSGTLFILLPFPLGKGPGVRFSGHKLLLLSIVALITSCAQVHEKMFTLDCAIGRRPLPGELAPGTAMALDVSTSPIPLLFPRIARSRDATMPAS